MIRTIAGLRTRLADARAAAPEARVALISTIGSLHDGHIDLVHRAKELADIVVVSIFVNPLRFAGAAEWEAYPRTPEDDERLLDSLGVDVVFAPEAAELLPQGSNSTKISAGDLGLRYEGRTRPFYFDGLLTVEAKLFQLVDPDVVVYGLRDRQRIFLVRRMIRDLFFDIDVATVETVRDDRGLPISTRVGMLEPQDLAAAAKLPAALDAAASNADRGIDACIAAAQSSLMGEPRIRLEYLSVVDPATFLPLDEGVSGPALVLIAASVAGHRFIDNAEVYLG
ncbi:pantoate--beta-alanine ligase [Microbacterium ulmi]|uniref:Pantothenate synthetase n=1 Tax=Microbacterium ulmi TaxID=179095 RepID=A0A7Y2LZY3_9MICO|nr:pantoate--beta-alanine ligase [Microbacterium ulmi]NII69795.1 pantoate--beta-alanine ligase [Microbacterium ulmi]NNH03234.1 pantoate--beta-alanine ligase [Microbacterium ulmi]